MQAKVESNIILKRSLRDINFLLTFYVNRENYVIEYCLAFFADIYVLRSLKLKRMVLSACLSCACTSKRDDQFLSNL